MLSEKAKSEILDLKSRYPSRRSATLPALYAAQEDQRWLSPETIDEVAAMLELPSRMLHEVATFYVMFEKKPVGTHLVEVCDNISCALRGSEEILRHLEGRWGIRRGQTTPDGRFTLRTVECLGACGTGPCVMINHRYWEKLTPEDLERRLTTLGKDPHETPGDLALPPLPSPGNGGRAGASTGTPPQDGGSE
jgi:NADH-quinone oxidoreductase subunit E